MARARISLIREDRIWDLRVQGYDYDSIGRITNTNPGTVATVVHRVRRRPPIEVDPIRRGRRSGWMSDAQIEDIRTRRATGETLFSISKSYHVDANTIGAICRGKTYVTPEQAYPWSFENRLRGFQQQVAA